MKPEDRLNIDEVMCLQMAGMSTPDIMRTDLKAFDLLYARNEEEFEALIDRANSILDRQEKLGIVSYSCQDDDFPARLKAIGGDCPAVIHCLGNVGLLRQEKAVAVIGARSADSAGMKAAYKVAEDHAKRGYVIVSGLAIGCDTAAHRAALDAGAGTIAVVATGLDLIHPHESKALQDDILRHDGLILSEQPIGVKANPTRLVARNRLQAALSNAVILAQCPAQSGSLHTMRFARKYHRKQYAVTFPHWNDANRGNYNLLQTGGDKVLPLDLKL